MTAFNCNIIDHDPTGAVCGIYGAIDDDLVDTVRQTHKQPVPNAAGLKPKGGHEHLIRYVNCALRMRRECREHFPRDRLQRKPLVSDPGMHHGTWVTHVP